MTPKILGINDDCTTCDCCGKSNLKKTVVLDFDGDIRHYGSDCAASVLYGKKSSSNRERVNLTALVVGKAISWMQQTGDAVKVAGAIQGRWGYQCGPYRGGLEIAGLHIRKDGSIGEPTGPIVTR